MTMTLEDLQPNTTVQGILPNAHVQVINVEWHGSSVLTLVYRNASGQIGNELLYRHDEPRLEIVHAGRL